MWSGTAQSCKTFAVFFFFFSHSTLGCRHKMLMIIHKKASGKGCVSSAEQRSVPAVTENQRRGAGPVAASCGSWSPPAREAHPPQLSSANAKSMLRAATVHPPTRSSRTEKQIKQSPHRTRSGENTLQRKVCLCQPDKHIHWLLASALSLSSCGKYLAKHFNMLDA